ncbi:hypothetical protein [Nocardioides ungokensis]|uniref:hypothetical protein n=1 Tax=Nocardioides ungokensis TaxID=1643322 RepID=UPI0015DE54EA|nr:hypothetical protein [Nocardioides ungokensis]
MPWPLRVATSRSGVCEDEARGGMATTLSAVLCDGERVLLGHVGDSRAYLLHDGVLRQVSRDQPTSSRCATRAS